MSLQAVARQTNDQQAQESDLAKALSKDKRGVVRDEYCSLFFKLCDQARQDMRQPCTAQEHARLFAITEAALAAANVIDQCWKQQHY
jgi:hypothetical protein